MLLQGTIRNGTIVLDQPTEFREGTRVEVDVKERAAPAENKATLLSLLKLAGTLDDLPADFAAELDHYIHGTPKRSPKGS